MSLMAGMGAKLTLLPEPDQRRRQQADDGTGAQLTASAFCTAQTVTTEACPNLAKACRHLNEHWETVLGHCWSSGAMLAYGDTNTRKMKNFHIPLRGEFCWSVHSG
jgi:hypothetical protein